MKNETVLWKPSWNQAKRLLILNIEILIWLIYTLFDAHVQATVSNLHAWHFLETIAVYYLSAYFLLYVSCSCSALYQHLFVVLNQKTKIYYVMYSIYWNRPGKQISLRKWVGLFSFSPNRLLIRVSNRSGLGFREKGIATRKFSIRLVKLSTFGEITIKCRDT